MKKSSSKKEYLISLYNTRSIIALFAGILVVVLATVAVTEKILGNGGLPYVFALVIFITLLLHILFGIFTLIGHISKKA